MNVNKLTLWIVGLVIGATLFAGILLPTVNSITDKTIIEYNNAVGAYAKAPSSNEVVFEFTNDIDTGVYTWVVNDEIVYNGQTDTIGLLYADGYCLMGGQDKGAWLTHGDVGVGYYGQVSKATLTYSDNHLTGEILTSWGGSPATYPVDAPVDWLFYANTTGDYRNMHITEDSKIYLNDVNQMYGTNWIVTTISMYSFHGLDVKEWVVGESAPNEIKATAQLTPADNKGVYELTLKTVNSDYSIIVDNSGEDYTVSPWNVIVPAKVIGEKMTNGIVYNALFGVIPLMVLVMLIVYAAAAIRSKY